MAIVYITGGATGIGAATVRKFVSGGDRVVVFDINDSAMEELIREFESGMVHFFKTDVRSRNEVRQSMGEALDKVGPPEALFVNAGIQKLQCIFDMEDEDIDLIIDVNLFCILGHER